jgi:hypothetical protein
MLGFLISQLLLKSGGPAGLHLVFFFWTGTGVLWARLWFALVPERGRPPFLESPDTPPAPDAVALLGAAASDGDGDGSEAGSGTALADIEMAPTKGAESSSSPEPGVPWRRFLTHPVALALYLNHAAANFVQCVPTSV